jgi:hypothetical protein
MFAMAIFVSFLSNEAIGTQKPAAEKRPNTYFLLWREGQKQRKIL